MKTITGKLKDLDKVLQELHEENNYDSIELPDGDVDLIYLTGPEIRIPALNLRIYEGEYWVGYVADFSLTAVYEGDAKVTEPPTYWEQDPIDVTLYNFLAHTSRNMTVAQIEELEFEITDNDTARTTSEGSGEEGR